MEQLLKGKLENIFLAKDFLNKETGEIETKGKWQAQFIERVESEEGIQMVMHKVSLPEEKAKQLKSKVGETVTINVKAYVQKGKLGFYGI